MPATLHLTLWAMWTMFTMFTEHHVTECQNLQLWKLSFFKSVNFQPNPFLRFLSPQCQRAKTTKRTTKGRTKRATKRTTKTATKRTTKMRRQKALIDQSKWSIAVNRRIRWLNKRLIDFHRRRPYWHSWIFLSESPQYSRLNRDSIRVIWPYRHIGIQLHWKSTIIAGRWE